MRQNTTISWSKYLQVAMVCIAPLTALSTVAAQETPTEETLAAEEFAIPESEHVSSDSYDLLVMAGKSIEAGGEGPPDADEVSPEEDLKRQRAFTQKNAASLKMMQEALSKPIITPSERDFYTLGATSNGALRSLARLAAQRNRVAAADNEWDKAVGGALDIVQMGVVVEEKTTLVGMMSSGAVQKLGREDVWRWIEPSDAPTALAGAQRLEKLDAATPSFAAIMREEKWVSLSMMKEWFTSEQWQEFRQGKDDEIKKAFDKTFDLAKLRKLSDRDILRNYIATIDAVIAQAELPYDPNRAPVAASADPLSDISTSQFTSSSKFLSLNHFRAIMEKSRAENRLLMTALALHAFEKDNAQYPEKLGELRGKYLQEVPRDPFAADAPLVYKREGESYVLYSIGADGVDNDGVMVERGAPDKNGTVPRLAFDAPGDLVAGQFK